MSEALSAIRTLRIDPEQWKAARVKALSEGTTVSAVVRELLQGYLDN